MRSRLFSNGQPDACQQSPALGKPGYDWDAFYKPLQPALAMQTHTLPGRQCIMGVLNFFFKKTKLPNLTDPVQTHAALQKYVIGPQMWNCFLLFKTCLGCV